MGDCRSCSPSSMNCLRLILDKYGVHTTATVNCAVCTVWAAAFVGTKPFVRCYYDVCMLFVFAFVAFH